MKLVNWGKEYLQQKGIDSPRLTIELLLCKVLGIDRIEIYTNFEKPLTENELANLKSLIKRRLAGEPLQHVHVFPRRRCDQDGDEPKKTPPPYPQQTQDNGQQHRGTDDAQQEAPVPFAQGYSSPGNPP